VASLTDIREALAAGLKESLPAGEVQVSAYILANPSPPTVQIFPGETDWHQALQDGLEKRELIVQALVGTPTEEGAQRRLDGFLASTGEFSLKAAIEKIAPGDQTVTLGGLVEDVEVVKTKGYQVYKTEGKPPQLGAEWIVDVYVIGSDE
jgi:microcompartment protein CcmL/EutN